MEEMERRTYKKSSVILGVTLAVILCLLTASNFYILQRIRELEADIVQLTGKVNELEAVIRSLFEGELTAEVIVDANDSIGAIDRNIYGHFIEHLDDCVYKGVWVGEDSPIPNKDGLRVDILEAVKAMKPPIIRWPGGCFADTYHWKDGIGPPNQRPELPNYHWGGIEKNQFGTHEFIDFCREVNAESYIVVNVGNGTAREAADWVEYCNSKEGEWAQNRTDNGHPEPFNVTYWGLGNELYGTWENGTMSATEYAHNTVEFAEAMRNANSSIPIKLIAVGWDENEAWNRELLEVAGQHIDCLSIHKYYDWTNYYDVVAYPLDAENRFKDVSSLIDEVIGERRMIKIAFDEWNLRWDPWWSPKPSEFFEDGLFAAGMFNVLHRMCNNVTVANLAQLVNVPGLAVPLFTSDQGTLQKTPVYLAFQLYAENTGDIVLKTMTEVNSYMCYGIGETPFLDCSATIDNDRETLYLAAINRHKTNQIKCEIELRDFDVTQQYEVHELNGKNLGITSRLENLEGNPFSYTFPPHSVTILKFKTNPSSP